MQKEVEIERKVSTSKKNYPVEKTKAKEVEFIERINDIIPFGDFILKYPEFEERNREDLRKILSEKNH